MKQKLILLMVLIAGIAACSKDEESDDNIGVPMSEAVVEYEEYEGNWILNNERIDTATLIIQDKETLLVKAPYALIKYAMTFISSEVNKEIKTVDDLTIKINNACTDSVGISNFVIGLPCTNPQGYSERKTYFNINDLNEYGFRHIAEGWTYNSNSKRYTLIIWVLTEKPMLAIYDMDTNLWTIKITLSKVYIENVGADKSRIWDFPSPLELIYVTTKKVREYKSN